MTLDLVLQLLPYSDLEADVTQMVLLSENTFAIKEFFDFFRRSG